jgi:GNAT superfamily N-acetyltransferase
VTRTWPAPRVARPDDVPALVDVTNRAYVVEEFFIRGTRTTDAEARALMAQPAARFLVVDHPAGGLVASVFMEVRGDRGYFAMLAVDPAYQGQGAARLLIEAVEAECRGAGCRYLDIEVINLRTELPPFYARFGFIPHGTAPFEDVHKLLREAHAVLMTKSLE